MAAVLWKIAGETHDLSRGGIIMGVLNVTPDSFSDGGEFFDEAAAIQRGLTMAAEGAAIIDIGGESTRPGSEPIAEDVEMKRVLPVIKGLRAAGLKALISIDTTKAAVARAALDAGAVIINDITGGRGDAAMLPLAAERGAAVIMMHMQGTPRTMQVKPHYDDVVVEVGEFFRQQYARALECGIDPMGIAFDPGIGFGKTLQHNLALLRNLSELRVYDRPLAVGVSRKAFLGKIIVSAEMSDRLPPTIALTALLRRSGADVVRVHEVAPNLAALRVAEALETNTP
ncbi:MAG: dihydropteroate synthase [Chthoniobacterales bacterium]